MLTYPKFKGVAALEKAAQNSPYLGWGNSGPPVALVQKALADLGHKMPNTFRTGKPDGIYGNETYYALIAFQSGHPPLKPDGVLGKNTMLALDAAMALTAKPSMAPPKPPPPPAPIPATKVVKFSDTPSYFLTLEKLGTGSHVCRLNMSVGFVFSDGDAASWNSTAERRQFMMDWKRAVETKWSTSALHTSKTFGVVPFQVQIEATFGAAWTKEWTLKVTKVPVGASRSTQVRDGVIMINSPVKTNHPTGIDVDAIANQRAALYEFGRMIGLPYEFAESTNRFQWWDAPHQDDLNSIMNKGEVIRKRHLAKFRTWVKDYFNE